MTESQKATGLFTSLPITVWETLLYRIEILFTLFIYDISLIILYYGYQWQTVIKKSNVIFLDFKIICAKD